MFNIPINYCTHKLHTVSPLSLYMNMHIQIIFHIWKKYIQTQNYIWSLQLDTITTC